MAVPPPSSLPPLSPVGTLSGEALFWSLTRPAATEGVESLLRRFIVEHDLKPGDRLPSEAELGAALSCSRMVVREALRSLEALGLLESRAGSGWYVRSFDVRTAARILARRLAFHPRAPLELLAIRRSAEADIVAALAGRLTPPDLAALDELVDRMRWRAARGQSYAAEDGEFHRRIAAASGNSYALVLVDIHWAVKAAMYERGLATPAASDQPTFAEAHASIVEALRSGDGAEAARRLRAHHDESERRFTAWLASHSPGDAPDSAGATDSALLRALLWPGPGRGDGARG